MERTSQQQSFNSFAAYAKRAMRVAPAPTPDVEIVQTPGTGPPLSPLPSFRQLVSWKPPSLDPRVQVVEGSHASTSSHQPTSHHAPGDSAPDDHDIQDGSQQMTEDPPQATPSQPSSPLPMPGPSSHHPIQPAASPFPEPQSQSPPVPLTLSNSRRRLPKHIDTSRCAFSPCPFAPTSNSGPLKSKQWVDHLKKIHPDLELACPIWGCGFVSYTGAVYGVSAHIWVHFKEERRQRRGG